jgi:hypothetical protein
MSIVVGKNFSISVYPGDHPPPHCHVRYKDETEAWVELPSLKVHFGGKLTDDARESILEHFEKICAEYDSLNPKKIKNEEKTKRRTKK